MSMETEEKWTKGPWNFSKDHGGYAAHPSEVLGAIRGSVHGDEEDYVLATVISDCVSQAEANANLIAAAPDLYEACKVCLHVMEAQRIAGNECFHHYKLMAQRRKDEVLLPAMTKATKGQP